MIGPFNHMTKDANLAFVY